MLLCILGKLFNGIIADRITKYCVSEKVLNDAQDGFLPGRGTTCHGSKTGDDIWKCMSVVKKDGVYMLLIDLSKAFDCIGREKVYRNLRMAGIPEKMVRIMMDMHQKTRARYRINGENTKYVGTKQGVPQGDPLSPIIFNLVINPMLSELEKQNICFQFINNDTTSQSIKMYADDFMCICTDPEKLQKAINICKKTIDYFNLRANVKKSATMKFKPGETDQIFKHEKFTYK